MAAKKKTNPSTPTLDNNFLKRVAQTLNIGVAIVNSETWEIVFENAGRIRDIAQLPSGNLLILIDKGSPNSSFEGRILKLIPK